MKQIKLVTVVTFFLPTLWINSGCGQKEKSAIEIIKFDSTELRLIREKSDSIYRLPDTDESVVFQDNYFLKDGSVFWVWTDKKTGIVRGTKRVKNGITYNWVEYNSTSGQVLGQVETDSIDTSGERHWNGTVKHYYDNGRIKLLGQFVNSIQVGNWKYYDAQGNLDSIETYGSEGSLEKTSR